ncbi:zinc finger protein 271-like isoform X2 [Chelonus insularis]|uniref:zinc finger protein 271-like isoform X2 n=1 Tax=Chelonus insularis TaxID=460826 RepID=UPI00158EA4D8|nr:zinc finger protein 271-like isoform X2 [Chelonus insularis]
MVFTFRMVWQGDGLPEKLCNRCVTRAESALLFREQCRAADRALRQAAAKVAYTTVSGCKLYQQNQGLTSIQTSQKPIKCLECGAVFMDYQELYSHSRSHVSAIQDNISFPHMHIVESQNPHFNIDSPINDLIMTNNVNGSLAYARKSSTMTELTQRNDRAACAFHYSVYNYMLPNQNQLMNNHFSHLNNNIEASCDNSIDIGEDSSNSAEDFSFQRPDVQYFRDEHSLNPNSKSHFPENLTLTTAEQESNEINKEDLLIDLSNNIPRFSQDIQADNIINDSQNLSDDNDFEVQISNKDTANLINKKHKCKVCGKCFTQKSKLTTHELSHTGERPFKCQKCDKDYTSKSKLNAHMRLHTQVNVHQCNICKKIFSYPSYLIEHQKTHEKNSYKLKTILKFKKYECSTCNKNFCLKKNLNAHMKFHSGKNLFYCEVCHKPFSQKFNLKIHLELHKNTRTHKCEYCNKSFNGKGNYIEHLRIHTKVKPFVCELCDKAFSQSSHLKTHQATHNSQRPHQCRLCGKKFKLSSHLQRHMNLHTSIKAFKCTQCNQLFSQAFSLKRHLKKHSEVT